MERRPTLSELANLLGKEVVFDGQAVPALGYVIDVRTAFGRIDVRVKAAADGSQHWVSLKSCRVRD